MTDLLLDRDPNDSGEVVDLALTDQDTQNLPACSEKTRCGTETEELGRYMGPQWPPTLRRPDADGKKLYAPTQPKPPTLPPIPKPKPSHAGHLPPSPSDSGVIPMFVDIADRQAHAMGEYRERRSVPYVRPADRPGWEIASHRRPSVWRQAWARVRSAF